MRHEAENVPIFIANAGDVLQRTVGIGFFGNVPLAVRIPHQDLMVLIQFLDGRVIREIIAFTVSDGDFQDLAFF